MHQLSDKSAKQYYSILLDIHQWDIDFAIKVPIFKNLLEIGILNEITGKNHFEDKYENNKVKETGQKTYLLDNKEILDRFGDRIKGEVRKDLFTGINDLFAKRNTAEHIKKINFAAYMGTLNTITESIRDFSKIPIPNKLISILDGESEEPKPGPTGGKPKNKAQYEFKGEIFNKRKLVLAVIKSYVRDKPNITLKDLQNTFDKKIQGVLNVVDLYANKKGSIRYFSEYAIDLDNGQKIVVCNQWGIGNINKFIDKAKELGYKIIINE